MNAWITAASRSPATTILVAAVLVGCKSGPTTPVGRQVSLAEFAWSEPPIAPQVEPALPAPPTVEDRTGDEPVPATADGPVLAPGDRDDPVPSRPDRPLEPGERVIADSLVGQVNGRPIFADEFFEPVADRLVAAGGELSPLAFREEAARIILVQLRDVVLDELFLAEAESGLSTEQQMGLRAWIRSIQERVISTKGGGTRSQAEQRLMAEEGVGVDQFIGQLRNRALIGQLIRERIESRVVVSWRDVEREYQRRYDEFNPPANAQIARIRLNTERQADRIEQVRQGLARGEPFAGLAESVGMKDGGRWEEFELGPEGLGGIELRPAIRENVEHLQVGQTSEPFPVGSSTWWLHLAAIDQPEGRSLYDPALQRELSAAIFARRRTEEQNRFINTLLEEGIYDELNAMADRLLLIAILRYYQT